MQSNEDGNNGHVDGRTPPDSLQVDDPPPELRSILLPEAPKEPEGRIWGNVNIARKPLMARRELSNSSVHGLK